MSDLNYTLRSLQMQQSHHENESKRLSKMITQLIREEFPIGTHVAILSSSITGIIVSYEIREFVVLWYYGDAHYVGKKTRVTVDRIKKVGGDK